MICRNRKPFAVGGGCHEGFLLTEKILELVGMDDDLVHAPPHPYSPPNESRVDGHGTSSSISHADLLYVRSLYEFDGTTTVRSRKQSLRILDAKLLGSTLMRTVRSYGLWLQWVLRAHFQDRTPRYLNGSSIRLRFP